MDCEQFRLPSFSMGSFGSQASHIFGQHRNAYSLISERPEHGFGEVFDANIAAHGSSATFPARVYSTSGQIGCTAIVSVP